MRILYSTLILTITISNIKCQKCEWPLLRYIEPLCGVDKTCNYNAANQELMNMEICRRKNTLGVSPFMYIRWGKCPPGRKLCPPTNIANSRHYIKKEMLMNKKAVTKKKLKTKKTTTKP